MFGSWHGNRAGMGLVPQRASGRVRLSLRLAWDSRTCIRGLGPARQGRDIMPTTAETVRDALLAARREGSLIETASLPVPPSLADGLAIARAVNRGWIDPSYMAMARKGMTGLAKHVTAEGVVNDTCIGTNIGQTLEFYAQRERPSDDMHGRGPVLLAATELLMAKK